MLLENRITAGQVAVMSFFVLALVGWAFGCSPETCAKRAALGAILVYGVTVGAMKLIGIIVTDAVISAWIERQEEPDRDATT